MNKRMRTLVTLASLLMVLVGLPLFANAEEFQEGKDYRKLANPVPTPAGKLEVVELFWYGCPHCYKLEPRIEQWIENKPDNVEFVRIPAVLGRSWELGARAFFTADALGVLDTTHVKLFDAIHRQNRTINNKEQLAEFFAEQGVDNEAFSAAYDSFSVETSLKRSQQLVRRYRIDGVPTIIVNGKYVVTTSSAGSNARVFDIVDYLLAKEAGGSAS
jgi:thiol:disulfide interchange protein DsbA